MFLESSRYFSQKTVDTVTKTGRHVKAVKLRRLSVVTSKSIAVKGDQRLDIFSHRQYGDATRFWHIADANTELDAKQLLANTGRIINIPEQ